jgi:hypothetical protein
MDSQPIRLGVKNLEQFRNIDMLCQVLSLNDIDDFTTSLGVLMKLQ